MSAPTDFLRYVDPSPMVEQDILNRTAKQLDLHPTYDKLASALGKVASNFAAIQDGMTVIMGLMRDITIDPCFLELFRQFTSLFTIIGKSVSEQCSMNIKAFTDIMFPTLESHRNAFTKANSDLQKELEEYSQLSDKSKPDIVQQHEDNLESVMCARAHSMWGLEQYLKQTEGPAVDGIALVVSSVMKIVATEFSNFISSHKDDFNKIMRQDAKTQQMLRKAFHWQEEELTKSAGYVAAKEFWDVRRMRAAATDNTSVPSGILWIRGRRIVTAWTRKYAVFKDGVLSLYDTVTGELQQTIPIRLVTARPITKKKRRFCFKIQDPESHIQLAALTKYDMDMWFEALTKHNMSMLAPDTPSSGEPVAVTDSICADCGANDATWCSINWGTMLCLKCSGVHRQMSVKTSKVRSLQLDKLHSFIHDTIGLLSNSAANELLLERAAGDLDVNPRMDEQKRREFITRKYKDREWATTKEAPDPFEAIENGDYLGLLFALNFGKNESTFESMTVLQAAVQSGDPTLVAIAACCTDNIDAVDSNGWTALTYALVYGFTDIARFLIGMGARADRARVDMGVLACYVGDDEIIDQVLEVVAVNSRSSLTFRPVTTKFATGPSALLTELVIPERARQFLRRHTS